MAAAAGGGGMINDTVPAEQLAPLFWEQVSNNMLFRSHI